MPFWNLRRRTTSSFKKLTNHRRVSSGSMARGSDLSSSGVTISTRDAGCGMRDASPFVAGSNATRIPPPETFDQYRERALQVRQQRRIGPRRRQRVEIDVGGEQRFFEQRAARDDSSRRVDHRRRAGKALAALEPHEVRECDEHAMLLGDTAHDPLPPHDGRRQRLAFTIVVLARASGRRGTRHDEQLRALERGHRGGERMPRVLTDQDRGGPAPTGLERAHAVLAAVHETLFVEHAVRRQEHLAMHVPDCGLLVRVERDVERRVIDVILKALVEADDDVDRSTLVTGGEIARQRAGGDRELLDPAFHEVAGCCSFGKDDEVGLGIELRGLCDDGTDPRDIRVVLPFGWSELGDRETDVRHAWKDMTVRDGKGRYRTVRGLYIYRLLPPLTVPYRRGWYLTILYIALGGVAGTLSRYGLEGWIQSRSGSGFPLGTLIVNLAGSLLLGFILRLATGAAVISPDLRGGLTIGFCGAFTTMSTFSYESVTLLGDGDYLRAAIYMSATILGCVAAVVLGTALANRLL